jgi:pimeloyl-ACP methyl ester carboxylesterase
MVDLPLPIEILLQFAEDSYTVTTVKVGEVECLVAECEPFQVVVPRGTEFGQFFSGGGWRDVLRDLRAFPWFSSRIGGFSHAGFFKGARGLVDKGLFGRLRRDKPILLIGHSLGGALAVNAAAILDAEGFNVSSVVTFGAPRTFTKGTAERFKERGIYVVEFSNPGDPVPDVPFRWWGYRHINEVPTPRKANGYSISDNHMLPWYREAFANA